MLAQLCPYLEDKIELVLERIINLYYIRDTMNKDKWNMDSTL